jgi:hypothetical protein
MHLLYFLIPTKVSIKKYNKCIFLVYVVCDFPAIYATVFLCISAVVTDILE